MLWEGCVHGDKQDHMLSTLDVSNLEGKTCPIQEKKYQIKEWADICGPNRYVGQLLL